MIENIQIKDERIPLKIKSYPTSKRINIYVKADGITITKPKYCSTNLALKVLEQNREEIYGEYIKRKRESSCKNSIVDGSVVLFKGNEVKIKIEYICDKKISIKLVDDILDIQIYDGLEETEKEVYIENIIKQFLKNETYRILSKRLDYWANKIGVTYESVKIRYTKTRWGSCVKATKSLNFNSRIAMLPEKVADSVIVHELCHLKEANHGSNFWSLVYKYFPEYDECKDWIRDNGNKIEI